VDAVVKLPLLFLFVLGPSGYLAVAGGDLDVVDEVPLLGPLDEGPQHPALVGAIGEPLVDHRLGGVRQVDPSQWMSGMDLRLRQDGPRPVGR
jgi:hypothetical protein